MSFGSIVARIDQLPLEQIFADITADDVRRALAGSRLDEADLLALLSPAAEPFLEEMARKSLQLTRSHFGHVMQLFTPLYAADYCVNRCSYCSFSAEHEFPRRKLTMEQLASEAEAIARTGLKHVLLLTGESRKETPASYLVEAVQVLRRYFASVSIEVYPLTAEEYVQLVQAGADGLTLYQEVYHRDTYRQVHLQGPKRNYPFRLDGPERGCQAGFRTVHIGALLGMYDWRREAFLSGLHARYLQDRYPQCEVGLSTPRFRPYLGAYEPASPVSDKHLVQIILAYRLFMPRSGITLSTRESPELRDRLIHLGVTKMSAGVSTEVGGHSAEGGIPQFDISDERSVEEVSAMLRAGGLQPVFKDWDCLV